LNIYEIRGFHGSKMLVTIYNTALLQNPEALTTQIKSCNLHACSLKTPHSVSILPW